jgi:hypothetical protein
VKCRVNKAKFTFCTGNRGLRFQADHHHDCLVMAAAEIEELRRIRMAQAEEPARVVQLGVGLVNKAGKAAAGDECMHPVKSVAAD